MRIERANTSIKKGWYAGPWNSALSISVGYANVGLNEPHLHTRITEIYLIARGTSVIRVEDETVALSAGDIIIVEPGEAHTFIESSPDYFHFVIHTPGLAGDQARAEKSLVTPASLGL
jgi:mannose-6-phosphate isomerase-like protein (cupin superfamily)